MSQKPNRQFARLIPAVLLVVLGVLCGTLLRSDSEAGVRTPPPRSVFTSGAQRSEKILREIADTLKRIDARIERLEKAQSKR